MPTKLGYVDHLTKWEDAPLSVELSVNPMLASRLKSIGLCALTTDASSSTHYFEDIRSVRWWRTEKNESELNPDLPTLLCASRFVHHFHCHCREIGPHHCADPQFVVADLNQWLRQYVQSDPCDASERLLKPLAEGKIDISSLRTLPLGHEFSVSIELKPAYQFNSPYQRVYYTAWLPRITKGPSLQEEFVTKHVPIILAIADLQDNVSVRDKRFVLMNAENFTNRLKEGRIHLEVPNRHYQGL
jgi:hypothetical protein